jgi:hypothetical protein
MTRLREPRDPRRRNPVSPRNRVSRRLRPLLIAILIGMMPRGAFAQAQTAPAPAADVFDEDKKANDAKKTDAKAPDATQPVTDRDAIGFTQENVAAQMAELEERMFRLAEALRSLEPENASRLRLALKFSREELILQQMKETQKLLREAQLSQAETEVRELLAKLEHLRRLLLAEDLDFQMKLARLRQMRETLGQLERIIKEEQRELAWSRSAIGQQAEWARVTERRKDLETLVADQKAVVRDLRALTQADGAAAREAHRKRQARLREAASQLARDPVFADLRPPYLKLADPHLGDAVTLLATTDLEGAHAAAEKGLDALQNELDRLNDRIAKTEPAVSPAEFQRFEHDQARNRAASESLAATSARLGDSGVKLQKDLIRASGSMRSAEHNLAKTEAKPAAADQLAALKHLVKSRDELAKAVESLLVELRSELQSRILAELTEMHAMQVAIRESTAALAPRVAQGSRTALIQVAGLSQKEAELAERTEHLLALTEETEFGIALPTALRVLARAMRTAQTWLKAGDASGRTVALEERIEEDLLGLLEAMRRLPPTTPPSPGSPLPSDLRARERELNRLIAELKMIRLIQTRLNDDTIAVDHHRPEDAVLTPALRREIAGLKDAQEEIRDSLAKLAARLEPAADPQPPAASPKAEP